MGNTLDTTEEYTPHPENNKFFRWIILVIVAIFAAALILSSCNTEKRQQRRETKAAQKAIAKMAKAEDKYNGKSKIDSAGAHYCFTKHPVKIGQGKTIYKQGKTPPAPPPIVRYVNCDSLKAAGVETKSVPVPCPPCTHEPQVDTVEIHDTLNDTRQIKLLQAQYVGAMDEASKYKQNYEKAQSKVTKRTWWAIGGCSAFLLLVALLIYANIRKAGR